jgi:hypothetical protein
MSKTFPKQNTVYYVPGTNCLLCPGIDTNCRRDGNPAARDAHRPASYGQGSVSRPEHEDGRRGIAVGSK